MKISFSSLIALVGAYVRTRFLQSRFTNRCRIERWQTKRLEKLRRHAIKNTTFYKAIGNVPFANFPIISKADVMGEYQNFNSLGLTSSQAWEILESETSLDGYDIGCSTGTSGNRGLYVVSDHERFVWFGTIIAKAIPNILRERHRVAIILPRASRLYDTANESNLMKLQFFDLVDGLEAASKGITSFKPTVLVAPPKALRWMAEQDADINPKYIFSSAEVLDAPDRDLIEARYKIKLGQIYMATEGLFGVTCPHGIMHLAEDAVHFEYEPLGDDPNLVSPIVTDFTRRTQVMVRYRMNDLLRLDKTPCACGSALQAVSEIIGRYDDCFQLPSLNEEQKQIMITPDILRNCIIGVDQTINDFRLYQTGANKVKLVLSPDLPATLAHAAKIALLDCFSKNNTKPDITLHREIFQSDTIIKIRRVERKWLGT